MRCSSEAGAKSYLRWAAYSLISSFMFMCIFCWCCLHVLANPLSLCLDQIAHPFSLEKWHMWGLSLPFVCEPYLLFVLFLCFWSPFWNCSTVICQAYVSYKVLHIVIESLVIFYCKGLCIQTESRGY